MLRHILPLAIASCISIISIPALAKDLIPIPNQNGDYYSTKRADGKYQEYWVIVANNLNCRVDPGIKKPVMRTYHKNDIVQAIVPDSAISRDDTGKPWLRLGIDRGLCFLRANSRYIAPVR